MSNLIKSPYENFFNITKNITKCPLCNYQMNDMDFHGDSNICSLSSNHSNNNAFPYHGIAAYYFTLNNNLKSLWITIEKYSLSLHFDLNKSVLKFATGKYIVFPLDSLNIEYSIPSLLDFIKTYEIFQ